MYIVSYTPTSSHMNTSIPMCRDKYVGFNTIVKCVPYVHIPWVPLWKITKFKFALINKQNKRHRCVNHFVINHSYIRLNVIILHGIYLPNIGRTKLQITEFQCFIVSTVIFTSRGPCSHFFLSLLTDLCLTITFKFIFTLNLL